MTIKTEVGSARITRGMGDFTPMR